MHAHVPLHRIRKVAAERRMPELIVHQLLLGGKRQSGQLIPPLQGRRDATLELAAIELVGPEHLVEHAVEPVQYAAFHGVPINFDTEH